jgi:hypothetical protein
MPWLVLVLTTLILATSFFPIKRRLEGIAERRLVRHPAIAEAAGSIGLAPRSAGAAPSPSPAPPPAPADTAAFLADPAFLAALDARIRAVVAERGQSGPAPGGSEDGSDGGSGSAAS